MTTDSITQDATLPYPPEAVWTLLTNRTYLIRWFLPTTDFEAKPGASFLFDASSLHGTNYSPRVTGAVVDCEPAHRLSYTWNDADISTPTGWTVTYTLTPAGAGTHIRMVHAGFDHNNPQQSRAHGTLTQAWQAIFARLRTMPAPH